MASAGRIRGFVGQRMALKAPNTRVRGMADKTVAGAFTITSPAYATVAEAWLFGAGGSGEVSSGNAGGGGGEAVWRRFRCPAFTTLSGIVGALGASQVDGGSTSLTLPNGQVVSAAGGKTASLAVPGLGGGASTNVGVDEIRRRGGDGGAGGGTNAGAAGDHGGAGGIGLGTTGGGGGSGGFSDIGPTVGGGAGAKPAAGAIAAQYGGGGPGDSAAPAGDGRIFVVFTRVAT